MMRSFTPVKMIPTHFLLASLLICGVMHYSTIDGYAGPPIDSSPDRAATPLKVTLKHVGTLKPKSADEIKSSNWTLGCETLDRDFADYDEYKEYLVPLGIKTIRLQGGWAKTEKKKGGYDFSWLDAIVDDARGRGLNILLETGYGNSIYEGGGGTDLAGGFPTSTEGKKAWDAWVEAMANHYKGRVQDWAMWNEPDINKKHTPKDIADFNIRTAEIIRYIIPDARIAGLSLASSKPEVLRNCLEVLHRRGKVDLFHWFIYHGYEYNPDDSYGKVEALKATLAEFSKTAKMRQGENGAPSELCTDFALRNHPWTEYSQAKWDLRRMLGDLGHDVESSVFTISDFNHVGRIINRKGLLHATEDRKTDKIKLAYYAVQNCVSVFDYSLERVTTPAVGVMDEGTTTSFAYRNHDTGKGLAVYWDSSTIPGDSFDTRAAHLTVHDLDISDPVWIDLVSGRVYEIPADSIIRSDKFTIFQNLPLYDGPTLVADRSLITVVEL